MKWMSSSDDISLSGKFKLKTEIYSEPSLPICFKKLEINEYDLIITSQNIINQFKELEIFSKAKIINLAEFGRGEPRESWVNKVIFRANQFPYKRVIAIGGGTTIDIAKLCIFGDGRNVKELFTDKMLLTKKRELIAIPTTCGTGSEVTSVSVVEFDALSSKLGLQIDLLFPDKAILVGELLRQLPYKIFAITSIDALSHAVESLLSPKANLYTDMYAKSAIKGIIENLEEIRKKHCLPNDIQKSLICSNMAGIAFSNAGCATMHALSFPLSANYNLLHGEAVYAVFESVLEYYRLLGVNLDKLEEILSVAFNDRHEPILNFLNLLRDIYDCPDLKALGLTHEKCNDMAVNVYENQQRLLVNSPITLNPNDLASIYKNCL